MLTEFKTNMGSKPSGNAASAEQTMPLEEKPTGANFEPPRIQVDDTDEWLRARPENFGIDDGLLEGDGSKPPVTDTEGIPATRPGFPPNPVTF